MVLLVVVIPSSHIHAQSVQDNIEKVKVLIDEGKYEEGYRILQNITEDQVLLCGDLCTKYYHYEKGTCLYFMDRCEDAIPFLQKALSYMEKTPHEDCDYLEILYGIGSCYKKLGNYSKAEKYYRKVILKGNYYSLNCAVRNKTYSDLAELYNMMGKPEFADICTSRIESEMRMRGSKDLDIQINDLFDLFSAYDKQGKVDESIDVIKRILRLIDENKGKINEDYLYYSSLLGMQLRYSYNRPKDAAFVHKEIIEIGKQFKTYREDVYNAYEDYLRYLAENGKIDSIKQILPEAIKYYSSITKRSRQTDNLYEEIGVRLFEAKEYDAAISYLEKKWHGKTVNSIKALDCLGSYYFKREPARALSYYKNAESQILNGLEVNDHTKQTVFEYLMYLNERLGNLKEATKYAELAEPFIMEMHNDTYYLRHLVSWATECININDIEKANQLMNKVESLLRKSSIELSIGTLSNMGFVYLKLVRLEEAISTIDKGVKMAIKEKGEKCIELTTLYHNLGRAFMLKEDYSSALSALNKSKKLQLELEGKVMQRTADYINECESK